MTAGWRRGAAALAAVLTSVVAGAPVGLSASAVSAAQVSGADGSGWWSSLPGGAGAGPCGWRGVVDVYTQLPGATAAGTGIVLGSGLILTNAHVVAGGQAVEVIELDGPGPARAVAVTVVGADVRRDVAVLRVSGVGWPAAPLGDSDDVRPGDRVCAVGNAGGRGGAPATAPGVVTGLGVSVATEDEYRHTTRRLRGMVRVSARVRPGDSGGPLFDENGRVVGMDTAAGATGGFAIPIDTALAVARRHGWLNVPNPADATGEAISPDQDTSTRLLGTELSLGSTLPGLG